MWRHLRLILLRIYGSRTTKNVTSGNGVTLPYSCIAQTAWDEIAFFAWIIPDPLCNSDRAICYVPCGSTSCNKCVCVCVYLWHNNTNWSICLNAKHWQNGDKSEWHMYIILENWRLTLHPYLSHMSETSQFFASFHSSWSHRHMSSQLFTLKCRV